MQSAISDRDAEPNDDSLHSECDEPNPFALKLQILNLIDNKKN